MWGKKGFQKQVTPPPRSCRVPWQGVSREADGDFGGDHDQRKQLQRLLFLRAAHLFPVWMPAGLVVGVVGVCVDGKGIVGGEKVDGDPTLEQATLCSRVRF